MKRWWREGPLAWRNPREESNGGIRGRNPREESKGVKLGHVTLAKRPARKGPRVKGLSQSWSGCADENERVWVSSSRW